MRVPPSRGQLPWLRRAPALWLFDPVRRAAWLAPSAKAIANGNPPEPLDRRLVQRGLPG
jgi:hypothetical protein